MGERIEGPAIRVEMEAGARRKHKCQEVQARRNEKIKAEQKAKLFG